MTLDLEENKPKDVTSAKDMPADPTLLDEVFALEKKQEAAVTKAKDILSAEFGAPAECLQYKIQPDASLIVVYRIAKPVVPPAPPEMPGNPAPQ